MAQTLSIRLNEADRAILESAAKTAGTGVGTYVRQVAEAEARRLRRQAIRAESDRIAAQITPAALDLVATSAPEDWPEYGAPLPDAWRDAIPVIAAGPACDDRS